jgi:hypothetical protein
MEKNIKMVHYCLQCDTEFGENLDFDDPVFFCEPCYQLEMGKKAKKAMEKSNGSTRRSGRSNAGSHNYRINV